MAEQVESTKKRVKQRYFAVVKVTAGSTDSSGSSWDIQTMEFDSQNDLKKALATESVVEIVSITKGRRVNYKETRAVQLSLGE